MLPQLAVLAAEAAAAEPAMAAFWHTVRSVAEREAPSWFNCPISLVSLFASSHAINLQLRTKVFFQANVSLCIATQISPNSRLHQACVRSRSWQRSSFLVVIADTATVTCCEKFMHGKNLYRYSNVISQQGFCSVLFEVPSQTVDASVPTFIMSTHIGHVALSIMSHSHLAFVCPEPNVVQSDVT